MHTPGIASVCVCVCVWPNVGVPRRNGTVSSAAALCWTGGLEPVPAVAAPTPVESFALGLRRELPAEARASGGLAPARRPRTWQRTAPAASASGQGAHATSPQHQRLRARLLAACTLHAWHASGHAVHPGAHHNRHCCTQSPCTHNRPMLIARSSVSGRLVHACMHPTPSLTMTGTPPARALRSAVRERYLAGTSLGLIPLLR